MTTVLILNAVLAIVVLAAILSLLGWGIVTDNAVPMSVSRRLRRNRGRASVVRQAAQRRLAGAARATAELERI